MGDGAGAQELGIRWQSPAGVFWRQCLEPALLTASDKSLVSRDSLVLLLNCVITLVRPLRGRQTGFLCLQVPAWWNRRSSCQLGPLSPSPSRSCSQPPDNEAGGMGQCRDKPPTPAARVLGPGFVPVTKHTLAHLILKTISSYYYHPHFISAGTEAQRS